MAIRRWLSSRAWAVRGLALGGVLVAALVAAGLVRESGAHVRLFNTSGGQKLFWSNPANIPITIDPNGSDDIPGDSETTALRLGMRAWNEDPGSKARLVDGSFPITDACQDWLDTTSQIVFFDETNCSGFFPGMSSAVAVTPVWFNNKGQIIDADVIFNGQGFAFSTDQSGGTFDVQDVGTHELGHLLGLDHSGWAGATMFPYVDTGLVLQRSLSEDDVHGLRHIAPVGTHARISGKVRRLADNSVVVGAHVFATAADGSAAGADLTDGSGNFHLRGLDPGTYEVAVAPLEGAVNAGNLQPGRTIQTDFMASASTQATVTAGEQASIGDLYVDADVTLQLGTAFDDLPLEARSGSALVFSLSGSGLVAGSTLSCSHPDISISGVVWSNTSVTFTVGTVSLATPGHASLEVVDPFGQRAVLVAALEITPPAPTVTGLDQNKGNDIGGTPLTITGTGFRPGARVVIGDAIHYDGEDGCTVVDANTITLTTGPSQIGLFDVVVIDASGVEGRDVDAFTVASIPIVGTRFPAAGDDDGGTELVITGENFLPGLTVRIDSVPQVVALESSSVARVTTTGGGAGGPYVLEVENPGGETATSAFVYVAPPDPVLQVLTPAQAAPAGGKQITLTGAGFTPTSTVLFGVDPLTGAGGTAGAVTYVDGNTLEVVVPAMPAGRVAVMVLDAATSQASVLPDAFLFKAPSSGGGGGCHVVPLDAGRGPSDPLLGAAWVALLAALVVGCARSNRRRAPLLARARR